MKRLRIVDRRSAINGLAIVDCRSGLADRP
jgi:hypothetical protein